LRNVNSVAEVEAGIYAIETTDPANLLVELTTWLRDQQVIAREIRVGTATLEDVFLRLTTDTPPA
jgi:hypothetical protein